MFHLVIFVLVGWVDRYWGTDGGIRSRDLTHRKKLILVVSETPAGAPRVQEGGSAGLRAWACGGVESADEGPRDRRGSNVAGRVSRVATVGHVCRSSLGERVHGWWWLCWWWAVVVRGRWYSPRRSSRAPAFLSPQAELRRYQGCGELRKREHVILTGRDSDTLFRRRSHPLRGGVVTSYSHRSPGYAAGPPLRPPAPSVVRVEGSPRCEGRYDVLNFGAATRAINMVTKHFASQGEFLPSIPSTWSPLLSLSFFLVATPRASRCIFVIASAPNVSEGDNFS